MEARNRWGRAIGAGVLVELAIVVGFVAATIVYAKSATRSAPEKMAFIHSISVWFECIGSPIVTFLLARWVLRPLTSRYMAHALVVAGIAVAIHVSAFATSVTEGHEALWTFVLADALKVAGGVAAALLAQRATTPPAA